MGYTKCLTSHLTLPTSLPANGGAADRLKTNSTINAGGLLYYYIGGSTYNTSVDGSWSGYFSSTTYNSILRLLSHTNSQKYYIDLIFDVNKDSIFYRRVTNNSGPSLKQIDFVGDSRPASDVYAWAKAASKPSYTKAEVGLGNVANQGPNYYTQVYNSSTIGNKEDDGTCTVNTLAAAGNSTVGMIYHATDNPRGSKGWVHVWSQAWSSGSNTNWTSLIALGVHDSNGMWYRTQLGTAVGAAWKRVLDSSNYSSYAAPANCGVWPVRTYDMPSIKPTTTWSDTGIDSSSTYFPDGEGTYMCYVFPNHSNGTDGWPIRYAGYFLHYDSTNSTSYSEEILLLAGSHASYIRIFLRWLNTATSNRNRKLLIKAVKNYSAAYTITFKFRRII